MAENVREGLGMPKTPEPSLQDRASSSTWVRDLLVLTVVGLIWIASPLGLRQLGNPDEGRYSEIPREMAETGDYVTPRLNGVKYFEKPPLVYWLTASTFEVFGVNQFTCRIWNGLFAVLGLGLTYTAGRMLYGRRVGVWSALVLATALLYYALSQVVLLDMAVSVTISGALFAFMLGMKEPKGRRRHGWFLLFYGFMALAVLTKGLIGIVLPGGVIFFWTLLLNQWRRLFPFYLVTGGLLFLLIAVPWHVMAARANPEFLEFYFVHEHFERFTSKVHKRFEPWWYLLPCLVVGLFPWVVFAWQAVRRSLLGGWKARKEHREAWLMLIWIVFIVAFFSKSQSKLIPYILPVFPAAAVMIGRYLAEAWTAKSTQLLKHGGWVLASLALLIGVVVIFIKVPDSHPRLEANALWLKGTLSLVLIGGALAIAKGLKNGSAKGTLGAILAMTCLLLVATQGVGMGLDRRSTKRFAMIIKEDITPQDRVYSVALYTQDLPVYLERTIRVVDYQGELAFGIEAEPEATDSRFIRKAKFLNEWTEPGTAYAVLHRAHYDHWFKESLPHTVLDESRRLVFVSNQTNDTKP